MARPVAPPSFNRIFLFLWSGVFVLQPVPRRLRKESHIVLAVEPPGGGGGGPHASTHQHGGDDEVATATPANNAIPKAGGTGKLAGGWVTYGSSAATACEGNDARLSDARTPLAHTHPQSDVTGLVADLAAKVPTARLINTTAPLAGGGDLSADRTLTVADASTTLKGVVELATDGEAAAGVVVQGNDARMSNARTPTAHATTHQAGGSDPIKLDDLAAPDDNTDLNASTAAHGLMQKYPGGTTNFLRADGTFAAPTSSPSAPASASVAFTDGDTSRRVTVTDGSVTATSKIGELSIRRPDVEEDDDPGFIYQANVVKVATGSFDVQVVCRDWGDEDPDDDPPNETITLFYRVAA